MNKYMDSKNNMLSAVIAVMEQFQPLWLQTAGLREALASLQAYRAGIESGAIKQALPLKALTKKRREQRKAVIDVVLAAGSALTQHARDKNDPALLADAAINLTKLAHRRESETVTETGRVLELAKRHPAVFAPAVEGTPTLLDELIAAEKAYREAVEGRRHLVIERSNGTRGIASNTASAGQRLRNLDRLMRPFGKKEPAFYQAYVQARKTITRGPVAEATPEAGKEVTQPKAA